MQTSLLAEFRRRIQDTRYSRRAFGFTVSAQSGATSATLEVTNGHLIITIAGGSSPSLDLYLSNPRYDTVGKIYQVLSRTPGFIVNIDEDASEDHPSIDLESFGPLDVLGVGVDLKHRIFSDSELEEVLRDAVRRHNPTLNVSTLPQQETPFVVSLAHANVCRIQAYDASKRHGLDRDVSSLIQLAESFERSYHEDVKRLARAITSPKESNPNTMHEGDIVLGKLFKRSPRTGLTAALASNIPPDPAVLIEPSDLDAEDTNVRVRWQRNTNIDFYSYELWMDSRSDVIRSTDSNRLTSSKVIFKSYSAGSGYDIVSFATFSEEYGQLCKSTVICDLEPETDYFFKLYIVDMDREVSCSNVVRLRTKAKRCMFDSTTYAAPVTGPAGTVVDVYFDSDYAAFTSSHALKIGEKIVTPTIVTGYNVRFTIPTFMKKDVNKDLVVISPNGLSDVQTDAIYVSST